MSPSSAVWMASMVGALLFFAAGALWSRARASGSRVAAAGRQRELDLGAAVEQLRVEAAELRRQLDASRQAAAGAEERARAALASPGREAGAEREGTALRRQVADLRRERDAVRAERDELRSVHAGVEHERDALRAQRDGLQRERDDARRARAGLTEERDRARSELAAIAKERDQARRALASANEERDDARRVGEETQRERARLEEELAGRTRERDALRAELTTAERRLAEARDAADERDRLAGRLDEAERRAARADELSGAEERRVELALELEVLRSRLSELEPLQDEVARLRELEAERDELLGRLEAANSEAARMRARGFARGSKPPTPPLRADASGGTANALQSMLDGLAAAPGMRSAALADDLGLPIVGLGEHSSPLAAFGGFLDGIARKTSEFLPMQGLRRVLVEDEHGASVSAFPVVAGESRIALVTLTVDATPPAGQMARLLESVATMVR